MDKINNNKIIKTLSRLETISQLNLNNYFNELKLIFDNEYQKFIDAGVSNILSLDVIDYLLKQNRPEEEIIMILEKYITYNKTIQNIISKNNVFTTRGVIDELINLSSICKRFIDYHTRILTSKSGKKLANLIKESLRESTCSIKIIANILNKRLMENHERFNGIDYYKFKEKIKGTIAENNLYPNNKELVYLFMHGASNTPSSIVTRHNGIEHLIKKTFQNPEKWKEVSGKSQINTTSKRLDSLYTFAASAYLY